MRSYCHVFQTTENPTVYLPNDPNLGILRNVSRVKLPKAIPNDADFVSKQLPNHGVSFSKRYPVKIQMKWSGQTKSHHLYFKCPKWADLWDLVAWYQKTVLVGSHGNPLDFGMLTIWGGNATLECLEMGFFQNAQNPITYTSKCPKFGDSEKLTRNVTHFGEVSIHISGG